MFSRSPCSSICLRFHIPFWAPTHPPLHPSPLSIRPCDQASARTEEPSRLLVRGTGRHGTGRGRGRRSGEHRSVRAGFASEWICFLERSLESEHISTPLLFHVLSNDLSLGGLTVDTLKKEQK